MLNKVGIKMQLMRSKDAFCLMGNTPNDAKLEITHAVLFVRKMKISPSVFVIHAQALQNSTAKYPIKRTVCKALAILQHYRDVTYEKEVSGQLPTRLVVGLVSNVTFNESRVHNLFDISCKDYKKGYALYAFNQIADLREDDQPGETWKPVTLAKVQHEASGDGHRTRLRKV